MIRTSSPRRQFAGKWRFTSPGEFYSWELLGSFLSLPNHSGVLLFVATQNVKKHLVTSWKVYSPLDLIEALELRPNNQKTLSASEKFFFAHRQLWK